jgi:hypothetical protein
MFKSTLPNEQVVTTYLIWYYHSINHLKKKSKKHFSASLFIHFWLNCQGNHKFADSRDTSIYIRYPYVRHLTEKNAIYIYNLNRMGSYLG